MNEVAEQTVRKSREEWVELMAAYEAGDLAQREFCERHEVAYSTFGYWRKQLRSPAVQAVRISEPLLELLAISPVPPETYKDSTIFSQFSAWTYTVSTVKAGQNHRRKISLAIQSCAGKRHHRRAVSIARATRGQARFIDAFDGT